MLPVLSCSSFVWQPCDSSLIVEDSGNTVRKQGGSEAKWSTAIGSSLYQAGRHLIQIRIVKDAPTSSSYAGFVLLCVIHYLDLDVACFVSVGDLLSALSRPHFLLLTPATWGSLALGPLSGMDKFASIQVISRELQLTLNIIAFLFL